MKQKEEAIRIGYQQHIVSLVPVFWDLVDKASQVTIPLP
jgi:hypothetical protein